MKELTIELLLILLSAIKKQKKKLVIVLFTIFFFVSTGNKTLVNQSNTYLENEKKVTLTYYHPGDQTGSGQCTGSGKCAGEFGIDSHGWYTYTEDDITYLVLATATKECQNSKTCMQHVNNYV